MKIYFLEKALEDLKWFSFYYENIFSQGKEKAKKHFLISKTILKANPFAGQEIKKGYRKLPILKTPFSFIYTVKRDLIEIVRIWDGRRDDTNNLGD